METLEPRILTPLEALEQVVAQVGGQSALARLCGVAQSTVWKWLHSTGQLPAEHVLAVEAATAISRHVLRPDIYPANLGPSPDWQGIAQGAAQVRFNTSENSQVAA